MARAPGISAQNRGSLRARLFLSASPSIGFTFGRQIPARRIESRPGLLHQLKGLVLRQALFIRAGRGIQQPVKMFLPYGQSLPALGGGNGLLAG